MPLFEFKCINCGHMEEVIIKPSQVDDALRINQILCEICGGSSDKLLSTPASIIVRNNKTNKRRYEG